MSFPLLILFQIGLQILRLGAYKEARILYTLYGWLDMANKYRPGGIE